MAPAFSHSENIERMFLDRMFPAQSLKLTFYFSSVEYKTEIKSSNEKKNPHKETFCPQQHLFTQIEFQLWKKRQEQRFIGHVKQVK